MSENYTREDAVRELTAQVVVPETQAAPEPVAEAVEAVAEPEAEVQETQTEELAEGQQPEAETPTEEVETEAAAPVDAPQWWDAEHKAVFATLTPEQQAAVKANEDKREAVVQKEKTAATEARKASLAEIERVRAISEKLDGIIPDRVEAFKAKWNDVDWVQAAREYPNEYLVWQAEYTAEKADLEQAMSVKAEADATHQQAFAREQAERLKEIAPDLATNHDALRGLVTYAQERGYSAEALRQATADDLLILNESRLYREMKAKAEATQKAPPKPVTPPVKPVKPVGSPIQSNPAAQEVQTLRNRFNQTKSRADAAALMMAEERLKQ